METNIYEPAHYALSYREETRQYQAEKRDEANTEETLSIMADWVQLHQYDNRHDFACLIDEVILGWNHMGRPALPGHDEITNAVIDQAFSGMEESGAYSAESYMLCASICEATDSNHSPEVKETPAYNALFATIKKAVEMQGSDDEWRY